MAVFFSYAPFIFTPRFERESFSLAGLASTAHKGRFVRGYSESPSNPDHLDQEIEDIAGIEVFGQTPALSYSRGHVTSTRGGNAFLVGGHHLKVGEDRHLTGGIVKFLSYADVTTPSGTPYMKFGLMDLTVSARELMKVARTKTLSDDRALLLRIFSGDDLIISSSNGRKMEYIVSGAGDDFVVAGKGDASIYLGSGDDIGKGGNRDNGIYGGAGHDILFGGPRYDFLYGGTGNDILLASNPATDVRGGEVLAGGSGADIFVLRADLPDSEYDLSDNVEDFQVGVDKIALPVAGIRFEDIELRQVSRGCCLNYRGQCFALLRGVQASDLTANDFLFGADAKVPIAAALQYFMDHWDYAA